MIESYPLSWPLGYKRTRIRQNSKFKQTPEQAQKFLHEEISRIGGIAMVMSSNVPVRKDGYVYSDMCQSRIEDPGIAVYFKLKGKDIAMCCDRYCYPWENIYALAKGIEALRGLDRWGVSDFLDRVFTGFKLLNETADEWWAVLGCRAEAGQDEIKQKYRSLAKELHPDVGGSVDSFNRLQKAYETGIASVQ